MLKRHSTFKSYLLNMQNVTCTHKTILHIYSYCMSSVKWLPYRFYLLYVRLWCKMRSDLHFNFQSKKSHSCVIVRICNKAYLHMQMWTWICHVFSYYIANMHVIFTYRSCLRPSDLVSPGFPNQARSYPTRLMRILLLCCLPSTIVYEFRYWKTAILAQKSVSN